MLKILFWIILVLLVVGLIFLCIKVPAVGFKILDGMGRFIYSTAKIVTKATIGLGKLGVSAFKHYRNNHKNEIVIDNRSKEVFITDKPNNVREYSDSPITLEVKSSNIFINK